MITLSWYLLKVIICSGILCGYYFLALRNKTFHRWNRFYILASIVLALIVPLMKINIFQNESDKGTVIKVLQTISYGDEAVIEYSKSGFHIDSETLLESGYLMISMIFLSIFIISLFKIRSLKKRFPRAKIKDISFINTNAKGTPFSFLKSIFWNNAIDLQSKQGQKIFNHELAHVKEKHSYDKIFMNVVLIFFWVNPFFWLMRKELYMIHEFIADKEALEDNDLNDFAEMILQTVYPGQKFSIINSFFYSPIKRRLLMLTKNKNPKVNYVSRLLVLPLTAIVFFAFTIKMKTIKTSPLYDGKRITVVIDAGHGGEDGGAAEGNIKEKDLTLNIAKLVKELNDNKNITIVLTRDNDEYMTVKEKVNFATSKEADLFISIHINKEEKKNLHSGIDILIPGNDNKFVSQSKLLGSSIIEVFRSNYSLPVANDLKQQGYTSWVLKANQCPSVLIEAGYLSSKKDLNYLVNPINQQMIARNILNGIENYAGQNELLNDTQPSVADSIPHMYYKGKKVTNIERPSTPSEAKVTAPVIKVTYNDGSTEMISEQEAEKREFLPPPPPPPNAIMFHGKISTRVEGISGHRVVCYFRDGTTDTITREEAKKAGFILFAPPKTEKIDTEKITKGILLVSPPDAIQIQAEELISAEFSEKHRIDPLKAVLIINGKEVPNETLRKKWITAKKVTIYQGDKPGLTDKYGDKAKNGVIICEDATVKDTPPLGKPSSGTDKVFTQVETEASFPGGQGSWQRYITKRIVASLDSFTRTDFGTCILRFIVNTNGTVSDVSATTMKGTQLANIAVDAIRKGPKWIPASQNGHSVASYRLQPVTLTNPDAFNTDTLPDKIFTKVETEASFPGGPAAWQQYIAKSIQASLDSFTRADFGTCILRFIVNAEGIVSNVKATTMQGTQLARFAIDAIRKGPKWIPASQNGHTVASYRLQPLTLTDPSAFNKSLQDLERPARFSGGQAAWLKYITRTIDNNSSVLLADNSNLGTCNVGFTVDKDGNVNEVQATTLKGTQLAEIAVNVIKKARGWNP
ncbi:MAG: N-acetylmuramoyl-L-alanine amidase [Ginsengibacter sp.]